MFATSPSFIAIASTPPAPFAAWRHPPRLLGDRRDRNHRARRSEMVAELAEQARSAVYEIVDRC
jgi:hypothetical protein